MKLPWICAIFIIFIETINFCCGFEHLKSEQGIEDGLRTEMYNINCYFKNNNIEDSNIMYVTSNWSKKSARAYDTFLDGRNNYEISVKELRDMFYSKKCSDISILERGFSRFIWKRNYMLQSVDYFIVDKLDNGIFDIIDGCKEIKEISGDDYKVYKNINNETIEYKWNDELVINCMEKGYNVDAFVNSGLSHCEGDFSWTEGNELEVRGYIKKRIETVTVTIEVEDTFNGKQRLLVYQGQNLIFNGFCDGDKDISFMIAPKKGDCSFTILFPDAIAPDEVNHQGDLRKLAVAINRIVIK